MIRPLALFGFTLAAVLAIAPAAGNGACLAFFIVSSLLAGLLFVVMAFKKTAAVSRAFVFFLAAATAAGAYYVRDTAYYRPAALFDGKVCLVEGQLCEPPALVDGSFVYTIKTSVIESAEYRFELPVKIRAYSENPLDAEVFDLVSMRAPLSLPKTARYDDAFDSRAYNKRRGYTFLPSPRADC